MYKDIEDLFTNMKIRNYAAEGSDAFMLPYFQKNTDYKIVMYGGGKLCKPALKWLKDILNIVPEFIIDVAPAGGVIDNIPVISLNEFENAYLQNKTNNKYVVVMATLFYTNNRDERTEIVSRLIKSGMIKAIDIAEIIQRIIKIDWFYYIMEHKQDFICSYELYEDKLSRNTYIAFLSALMEGHAYEGIELLEKDKYFCEKNKNDIYVHDEKECWVNLGACRGDTIFHYINGGYEFEKIYAVEGDKNIIGTLRRNLDYLNKEERRRVEIIYQYCGNADNELNLDVALGHEKISLINMDIEGAEYGAIYTAKNIIETQRPVLAICAYHRPDDLVRLPGLIQSIANDYKFVLRKYPSAGGLSYNGMFRTNELVLYAVPLERLNMH